MTTTTSTTKRTPRRRRAVLAALQASGSFTTASDLHDLLQEGETPMALATVYRHLQSLVADGAADTIDTAGGQLFRACSGHGHHHHLICSDCGASHEVTIPHEALLRKEARRHGFKIERHVLEVFGRCAECSQAK